MTGGDRLVSRGSKQGGRLRNSNQLRRLVNSKLSLVIGGRATLYIQEPKYLDVGFRFGQSLFGRCVLMGMHVTGLLCVLAVCGHHGVLSHTLRIVVCTIGRKLET